MKTCDRTGAFGDLSAIAAQVHNIGGFCFLESGFNAFGHEIAAVLRLTLADGFVGAYFVGSIALGGYVRGESDIDIVAVCDEEGDAATRQVVIEKVLELTPNCPARGLEFTMYRARVASPPRADTGFELNVNGGPRMPRSVHLLPQDEPRFWYVLDRFPISV